MDKTAESGNVSCRKLLLLGVGQTARALLSSFDDDESPLNRDSFDCIYGTTRSAERASELLSSGISPLCTDKESDISSLADIARGAYVLVSFPPDGTSDAKFAQLVKGAVKVVYISSTGVYGTTSGRIDEESPVDVVGSALRLQAEDIWRDTGAVILRAPGLYQGVTGMLNRLSSGQYRLPGDGSNYVSRIHLFDLAQIIQAAFLRAPAGALYVTGDRHPATHREIVSWLCQRYDLPVPDTVPLDQVHVTLRGNRQIDSSKVLRELGVELRYPSYVEGFTID